MKLQVALFNWLQMVIVAKARPDDHAAKETLDFFVQILQEDHKLTSFEAVLQNNEDTYVVRYIANDILHTELFDREDAERLWLEIEANPKYNE
ncbi:hypothetical protein KIK04_03110 [Paenibacillus sp. 481]|nr:hypothetical protein KIK04_03110 [Paenibacillus sp. 481]